MADQPEIIEIQDSISLIEDGSEVSENVPIKLKNAIITNIKDTSASFFHKTQYYQITVITLENQYKIERRYSDFQWLKQTLLKKFPGLKVPSLPQKNFMVKLNISDKGFLQQRKIGLNNFLKKTIENNRINQKRTYNGFFRQNMKEFQILKTEITKKLNKNTFMDIFKQKAVQIQNLQLEIKSPQQQYDQIYKYKKAAERIVTLLKNIIDAFTQYLNQTLPQSLKIQHEYLQKIGSVSRDWNELYLDLCQHTYQVHHIYNHQTQNIKQFDETWKKDYQFEIKRIKQEGKKNGEKLQQIIEIYKTEIPKAYKNKLNIL